MPIATEVSIADFRDQFEGKDGSEEFERALEVYLTESKSLCMPALDLDVSHIDKVAKFAGWDLRHVCIDKERVRIDYEVNYHVFNGCNDLDLWEGEVRIVLGVIAGDSITFLTPDASLVRYTNDELNGAGHEA